MFLWQLFVHLRWTIYDLMRSSILWILEETTSRIQQIFFGLKTWLCLCTHFNHLHFLLLRHWSHVQRLLWRILDNGFESSNSDAMFLWQLFVHLRWTIYDDLMRSSILWILEETTSRIQQIFFGLKTWLCLWDASNRQRSIHARESSSPEAIWRNNHRSSQC